MAGTEGVARAGVERPKATGRPGGLTGRQMWVDSPGPSCIIRLEGRASFRGRPTRGGVT